MAINILKNERFHSMGAKYGGPSLEQLKKEAIQRVVDQEPILARGGLDHLIGFIPESDPPKLMWLLNILQQLDIGQLLSIAGLLENRFESQTRKY